MQEKESYTCQYCQSEFIPLRSDAKYCSNGCRYKAMHQKRLEQTFLEEKEQRRIKLTNQLASIQEQVKHYYAEKRRQEQLLQAKEKLLKLNRQLSGLSDKELYPHICEYQLKDLPPQSSKWHELNDYLRFCSDEEKRDIISDFKEMLEERVAQVQQMNRRFTLLPLLRLDQEHPYEDQIAEIENQLVELEKEVYVAPVPPALTSGKESSKRPKRIKRRSHPKEMGADDVLNLNFTTFILPGELGRFLGELDRNMIAFALTGDSGAGKTYLSFALAKLFITAKMKVKYFSLEEGIGKLTQEKIAFYELGNDLKITAEGTLGEIRSDAERFDVIIVDSYSKITANPEEFEELRQDYPQTIFVIIFQKTTSGSIRGGSSIKYNSSATINVVLKDGRPVSIMEKSRYGTQGWVYDNKSSRIIKEM